MNKNNKLQKFNLLLKAQLKLYLNNPLFYVTAIIFTSFIYINFFIKQQFFTGSGSSDLLLFFSSVPYVCILIIPAICYKANFTIYEDFIPGSRLLKILVNFSYVFICYALMLAFLFPGIIVVNFCGSVDAGQVITSYICLLFYGAGLISLCLLIQNITESQVICFVVSAIILAILNSAHLIPVYGNTTNFISELSKKISFAWRFDAASKGIIDTRDITFLCGATFLFIILNLLVKELKNGKKIQKSEKISYFLSVLIAILLVLNGNNLYKRIDLSKSKTYSLSNYTKQLTKKVQKNIKITYYRSASLNKLYPQIRDVSDFLILYSTLNKNISLQIKDPDKENLTDLLDSYGIYSQQLRNVKSNSTEFINVYSAIILEYQGNAEVIPFTMSAQTLEYDLDGRILHLLSGEERNVNIIIGNGMSYSNDYSYVVPYLTSQGFVCNQLFIQDPSFVGNLMSSHGPLLVIGDENINIENAIAIENYILQNKGNALFTVSPFTSKIEDDWSIKFSKSTNIVEILENWGIRFTNQLAGDLSCARITMYSQDNTTTTKIINYPLWISLLPQNNCYSGITEFWPAKIEIIDEQIAEPFLLSSPYAYVCEPDKGNKDSLFQTNPFILEETPDVTSQRETLVLGAKIHGKVKGLFNDFSSSEDVKIFVIPDQYLLNSLMNEYIGGEYGDYRNFDYATNLLLQLNGEEELASLQGRSITDKSLYKITDYGKFQRIHTAAYIIFFIITPVLLILIGVLVTKKKKRINNEKK